jgi:hypothetical protein
MMWEWHSGWAWFWMGALMLVFWGLVAWVVVTLVRQLTGPAAETAATLRRSSMSAMRRARSRTTSTNAAPS